MKVAVLTAVYDHWDTLKGYAPQTMPGVEWVAVTDDPALASGALDVPGWRTVYRPKPDVHPCLAAKEPKMCPERFTTAEITIWIDAAFQVGSRKFVAAMLELLGEGLLGQFAHPWRDCIYDEAEAAATLPRYYDEPIAAQVAHYQGLGHPAHWGLWETGVIVRRQCAQTRVFGEAWLAQNEQWSHQDQVSEPFVLRALGLRPVTLGRSSRECDWLAYEPSVRHG